jgi:UDP-2,3-diacylglucosamine pyrophosphatase LpxH
MLVIFSDVHLTDGSSGTTIDPRAFKKFGNILSDIIGDDPTKAKIKEIEVVLLGDIFDVIRSNLWVRKENNKQDQLIRPWSMPEDKDSEDWDRKRYTNEIVQAIINNPRNIQAMGYLKDCQKKWAKKDVKVDFTYLIGNHDWLINQYEKTRFDIA